MTNKNRQEWLPEIIVVGFFFLGFILSLLAYTINLLFVGGIEALWTATQNFIRWLLIPKNLSFFLMINALFAFILVRLRYHIQRLANSNKTCPNCNYQVHQIHRKIYQRLLSYYIPIRRYYCHHCGWKGLQVYNKTKRPRQLRYHY